MTSLLRLALLTIMSSVYLYFVFGSHAVLFKSQDVILMLNRLASRHVYCTSFLLVLIRLDCRH